VVLSALSIAGGIGFFVPESSLRDEGRLIQFDVVSDLY
jgi:hypothetical protein